MQQTPGLLSLFFSPSVSLFSISLCLSHVLIDLPCPRAHAMPCALLALRPVVSSAGSLEGMIRGLSGTAIDIDVAENENESGLGREDDGQLQGQVKDLEHGVKQGGKVATTRERPG